LAFIPDLVARVLTERGRSSWSAATRTVVLVAVRPAPGWGDPAFDTVDLLLWQADDLETIDDRAHRLTASSGPRINASVSGAAFATMLT
jgi:hypothetical protein